MANDNKKESHESVNLMNDWATELFTHERLCTENTKHNKHGNKISTFNYNQHDYITYQNT